MIARIRAFAAFWYHFIIGDDWRVAVGVVVALTITGLVGAGHTLPTWWITLVAVAIVLSVSVGRAASRGADRHSEAKVDEG